MKDTQVLIVSPEVKVVLFNPGVELSRFRTNWTHAIKTSAGAAGLLGRSRSGSGPDLCVY